MSLNDELAASCRFAYEHLRLADCPVAVPVEMAAFLHHPRLSARALTAARQAIENDPALRRHLAEVSSEAVVGKRGWAWLTNTDELSAEVIDLRNSLVQRDRQLARLQAELASLRLELAALQDGG